MNNIGEIMKLAPVIPVLMINDVAHAGPIAEALIEGGLRTLEVTLRTPVALDAIRQMVQVEGAVIGAGTVLNEADFEAGVDAGAKFLVSPGLTPRLIEKAIAARVPFLPGVQTATDIMRGLDLGLSRFKFFPAMSAGGIPALRALSGPFPRCRYCPTGGITQSTVLEWLALDVVDCVGGTWIVPPGRPDRARIAAAAKSLTELAEAATVKD